MFKWQKYRSAVVYFEAFTSDPQVLDVLGRSNHKLEGHMATPSTYLGKMITAVDWTLNKRVDDGILKCYVRMIITEETQNINMDVIINAMLEAQIKKLSSTFKNLTLIPSSVEATSSTSFKLQ